ncbi:hypothetical protein Ancab_014620 [Ancistrocladus abbreviatus]
MELEVLCQIRHCNIVNLLGYCLEMGRGFLFMSICLMEHCMTTSMVAFSPLNWSLGLKIAMQAAKGLEYLHGDASPPIVHRMSRHQTFLWILNGERRISDFGFSNMIERDLDEDMKNDVYNFGIVLLEILSGRKAYDVDYSPSKYCRVGTAP